MRQPRLCTWVPGGCLFPVEGIERWLMLTGEAEKQEATDMEDARVCLSPTVQALLRALGCRYHHHPCCRGEEMK